MGILTAARAGSTEAAVELMDQCLVADTVGTTLLRESHQARGIRRGTAKAAEPADGLWERLAAYAEWIPEHEYERRRRLSALRGHTVDSAHPPTHLRRQRLLLDAPAPAAVVADDGRERRIGAELDPARGALARRILGRAPGR
ncbi:hypothetical protein [Streptomyces palmae]|uniref:Uncharacterized protein n=1 Tax=Streptomyces palmae TaxID=1701085 RepID=A0A4Z0HBQ5_9ACTN|nr:hypothetical protein [Streptomyces palmae]TGB07818.1 hypothetical protein E4099_16600 [Streptomyces palmae]